MENPGGARRILSFALLCGVVLSMTASGGSAYAKQTWTVTAGGITKGFAVVANTFQPRTIEIGVGDSITWKFEEFHTVTFLGGKEPLNPFTQEGDKLYGNPEIFFPSGDQTYEGRGYRNSGTPPLDIEGIRKFRYSLTFTKPGTYHYICSIHGPEMNGTVMVKDRVSGSAAVVARRAKSEQTATLRVGEAAWAKLKPERKGKTVVISLVGNTKAGYSIYRFGHEPLVIARGTTVTWQVRDPFEIHTVTFPSGEKPPEFGIVEQQPSGPPRILFPAKAVKPTGTATYEGKGYVNSGILFHPGTPGNPPSSFSLTFTKPGRYAYRCLVHDEPEHMYGMIIVK